MAVASASWQVELDLFRGPLHTLLDLIERRELPVTRISLVQVADQFLALVHRSTALDLDLTAEFLHVAARLLWLKSLALLPHADDEPRDEEDAEEDLEARRPTPASPGGRTQSTDPVHRGAARRPRAPAHAPPHPFPRSGRRG